MEPEATSSPARSMGDSELAARRAKILDMARLLAAHLNHLPTEHSRRIRMEVQELIEEPRHFTAGFGR